MEGTNRCRDEGAECAGWHEIGRWIPWACIPYSMYSCGSSAVFWSWPKWIFHEDKENKKINQIREKSPRLCGQLNSRLRSLDFNSGWWAWSWLSKEFFKREICILTYYIRRILFVILLFSALDCRVEAKLEHWYITGLRQQDIVPSLVASIGDTASSLLKIEFETNPENSTADQTLVVQSQPVEVIYDAVSTRRKWILIKHILYFWHMVFFFFPFHI